MHVEPSADEQQRIAHGCSSQPKALHKALHVRGRHLRYECQPEGRDEELGDGKNEIEAHHDPRGHQDRLHLVGLHACEGGLVGQCEREEHQEEVGRGGDTHTDGDLHRGRNLDVAFAQPTEEPHDQRREGHDEEGVDALENLGALDGREAQVDVDDVEVDVVTCEIGQRIAVLVERNPEEDHDAEHGEQCVDALADLLRRHGDLLGRSLGTAGRSFLRRVGEALLVGQVDDQRHEHHHDGRDERIVETAVEDIEVAVAEIVQAGSRHGRAVEVGRIGVRREVGKPLAGHMLALGKVFVAQLGQLGVIVEIVDLEPPVAHADGDERREEAPDVNEHVENLETRLTLGAELLVVVHLPHERLEIALEKAVAEGYHQQAHARQRQVERQAGHGRRRGDGDNQVAQRHHHEPPHDGSLVVAGFVGNDTADERQQVNRSVESRIDIPRGRFVQAELGRDEQGQDSHHDVETETLAHIGKGRRDQSFGLSFHKLILVLVIFLIRCCFLVLDKDRKKIHIFV